MKIRFNQIVVIILIMTLPMLFFSSSYGQSNETIQKLDEIKFTIEEANDSNTNLFFVGMLIAGIAIGSTMVYAGIMKNESDHRLRPILSRGYHPESPNNQSYFLRLGKVEIQFVNTGPLPALDVSKECSIELHEQPGTISNRLPATGYHTEKIASLGPNETYSVDIPYDPKVHYSSARANDECYFELNLYYYSFSSFGSFRKKKYHYKMKGHFNRGYLMLDSVHMN